MIFMKGPTTDSLLLLDAPYQNENELGLPPLKWKCDCRDLQKDSSVPSIPENIESTKKKPFPQCGSFPFFSILVCQYLDQSYPVVGWRELAPFHSLLAHQPWCSVNLCYWYIWFIMYNCPSQQDSELSTRITQAAANILEDTLKAIYKYTKNRLCFIMKGDGKFDHSWN